jgi:site-specific DNA recombinase
MSQRGRVHIYCRVSSSGQEENSSFETQEAACRAWADARGLPVGSVAHEVFSSGELHRPQLDAMIAGLARGDIFLAYTPDRLSRHQKHPHILEWMIEERGARLAYVTQETARTEEEVLLGNVTNYTSAAERAKIRERTQRGRRARITNGKPIPGSKPPYGLAWADAEKTRLVHDPDTCQIARQIFDWALEGVSLAGIAARLAERGIPSPGGQSHWTPTAIRKLLIRPIYAGTYVAFRDKQERKVGGKYGKRPNDPGSTVTLEGIAEPIVTEQEQAQVIAQLERNKTTATRNNRDPESTLLRAGFITCGYCGWGMAVRNAPASDPTRSPIYRCTDTARELRSCPLPTIASRELDATVWDRVCAVLRNPAMIERELAKHRSGGGLDRELAGLDKRIAENASKQAKLTHNLALLDDPSPVIAQLNALSAGKKALEEQRDALVRRMADVEADRARVRSLTDWCEEVAAKLESASYAEKRMALEALGVEVRVFKPGATAEDGSPLPRWELNMRPIGSGEPLAYPSTRRECQGYDRDGRRTGCSSRCGRSGRSKYG